MYGTTLQLPGELIDIASENILPSSTFVQKLRELMANVRPIPTRVASRHSYIPNDLHTVPHVFVRKDATKNHFNRHTTALSRSLSVIQNTLWLKKEARMTQFHSTV